MTNSIVESLSHATLGSNLSACVRAEEAALDTGRDDLYEAARALTTIFRLEAWRRRLAITKAGDQSALDELNAGLGAVSVATIMTERGAPIALHLVRD